MNPNPPSVAASSDFEWKLQVAQRLGGIERAVADLVTHVAKQTDSVSTAMNRIADLEARELARTEAAAAVEKATRPWKRWGDRAAVAGITVFIVLVLLNADKIVKLFLHG